MQDRKEFDQANWIPTPKSNTEADNATTTNSTRKHPKCNIRSLMGKLSQK